MQWMYGCQLHDNGTTRGYNLYSYDGTDFLFLDMSTLNWHAANEKAELFKNKWDTTGQEATHMSNYLDNKCIKSLKEYVSLLNTLQSSRRKVCPKVSLFLKHSSSPEVVCHATGFFSKPLNMTWQKDGEDVHEDVELSKTLPNQDGSFQKRCILKVPAKELKKHNYTCVVQHSSLEKEIVLPVSQTPRACNIRYNVTVVILRATITELTADVLVDGVRFFRYPANITEEKMEDDLLKSRVQRVEGHKGDLNSFLSAIIKDFNHTKGSLQWLVACDGNNVSLTKGYMKFICGKNFITFQSKKENWTLSDDQAIVIKRSLNPEYAQNAKTILQEECAYWDNQYARDNDKDNYSPQNITAIPPGTTSTVSDMDREQFTSRVTTKKTESDACNIRYNVTVVILRATITELTADVLVDGVRFFRYPANITEEKMEDDLLKSRVQRVEGYKGDLNSFLSAIMKDFNHTKGSLQWLVACDGNNVSLTKGYMKFICGKNFITFQSKKENWTLSDDQAIVIKRSLNPEYAQNAKTILQEECAYWDNQYARDNHERKDNYSPQNITAIPPGTTSTVSDMDREQFTSRVTTKKTESDDKGLDGKTVAIIIAVVVALVAVPAGIVVWKNSGERSEELNIRYNRANSASGEDSLSFKGNEKNSVLNIKD
ncbi:uncharacterized protein Hap1MRO34_022974 [Clarias gariepinus]